MPGRAGQQTKVPVASRTTNKKVQAQDSNYCDTHTDKYEPRWLFVWETKERSCGEEKGAEQKNRDPKPLAAVNSLPYRIAVRHAASKPLPRH
jgi:hypothetical protein